MNNRTVVITGASSGIGEALAYALANEKINLFLFARRKEKLEAVAKKCKQLGAPCVDLQVGDVSDKNAVLKLQEKVKNITGEMILVNNAGLFTSQEFHQMDLQTIDELIYVNLLGVFYITHALLPIMLQHKMGQVINISSVAAKVVFPGCSVYSATKAGLLTFGQVLAKEVRSKGIRVSTVLPGMTNTEIWTTLDEKTKNRILSADSVAEIIKNLILLPPEVTVDEITITPPEGTL